MGFQGSAHLEEGCCPSIYPDKHLDNFTLKDIARILRKHKGNILNDTTLSMILTEIHRE
jgi:uncharacterized protein YejL (UPF0352 family)